MSNQPPQGPQWPQQPPQQGPQGQQPPGWGPPPPQSPQGAPTAQGWGQPPQQPPKTPTKSLWRRPWFLGLVAVVALIVIGNALGGGGDSTDQGTSTGGTSAQVTEAPSQGSAEQAPEAAGTGDSVRDGKFEFTVRKVECEKSRVGTKDFGVTAQGQFCFVYMKVENIGKEAQTLDGGSQYLFGSGGQKFDADTEAAIYLDDSKTFLEQINPGNAVDGIVVFDIPKSATPAKLELHDSPFSAGVEVQL